MKRALPIRVAIVLALALPALGAGSAAALTASAVATQTSGVAPLAVFFDARASSDTGANSNSAFLDFTYSWSFGDTPCQQRGDVWKYSGKSKCNDMGPVTGHVYETPGTYTAKVTVNHGGSSATKSLTITVQDPNQVFSGTATTCVSTSSDFSGCPAGARQVTSGADFSSILASYAGNGRRVLFHRGQRWNDAGSFGPTGNAGTLIGAFGSGAKPAIAIHAPTFTGSLSGSHLTVMDLSFTGDGTTNAVLLNCNYHTGPCRFPTLFRVDASNMFVTWGGDTKNFTYGTSNFNYGVSIVESSSTNRIDHKGANDMFWSGTNTLFMGNQSGQEQGQEHDLRIPFANGMVISHNLLDYSGPFNKHLIKLHNAINTSGAGCTQGVEIADNTLDGGPNGAEPLVNIAPQDSSHPGECVELVRVERNFFKTGNLAHKYVVFSGSNFLAADNIFDFTHGRPSNNPQGVAFEVAAPGMPTPTGLRAYNNVCYEPNAASLDIHCVNLGSGVTNVIARNNLVYSPALSGSVAVYNASGGSVTADHNLVASSNPFAQSQLALPQDYKLSPNSPAVDAGSSAIPTKGADYSGQPGSRMWGSTVDIGAWELKSSGGGGGAAPSAPVLLP